MLLNHRKSIAQNVALSDILPHNLINLYYEHWNSRQNFFLRISSFSLIYSTTLLMSFQSFKCYIKRILNAFSKIETILENKKKLVQNLSNSIIGFVKNKLICKLKSNINFLRKLRSSEFFEYVNRKIWRLLLPSRHLPLQS